MGKEPLSAEELAVPYSKYYELPFEDIREEDRAYLEAPMDAGQAMPAEESGNYIRNLGKDGYAANGYYPAPEGAYTACTVFLKDVTPEMLDWWFIWLNHPNPSVPAERGNLKYKIWCPPDHWDHHFLDEEHPDAGMRICESLDLGAGSPRKQIINRTLPVSLLGVEEEILKAAREQGVSIKFGGGCGPDGVIGGVGLTMFVPAEGGCIWTSRGWGGLVPQDGKLVKRGGGAFDEKATQLELRHNVLERRHLAKILPEIYRDYRNQPMDL